MAQVTITINSREYAIACDDGQEGRIMKLARILDEKARQLTAGGGQINENMLLAMSGLLLADDLLEARQPKNQMPAAEPQIQTVIKTVEKPVEPDWQLLDEELSGVVNDLFQGVKNLINEIKEL